MPDRSRKVETYVTRDGKDAFRAKGKTIAKEGIPL